MEILDSIYHDGSDASERALFKWLMDVASRGKYQTINGKWPYTVSAGHNAVLTPWGLTTQEVPQGTLVRVYYWVLEEYTVDGRMLKIDTTAKKNFHEVALFAKERYNIKEGKPYWRKVSDTLWTLSDMVSLGNDVVLQANVRLVEVTERK